MALLALDEMRELVLVMPWLGSPPPQSALSSICDPWIIISHSEHYARRPQAYLRVPNDHKLRVGTLCVEGIDLVGHVLRTLLNRRAV